MSDLALKPCPLCGVDLFHNGASELGDIYEHPNNGCAIQVAWFTATPEWVAKWNRRAIPSTVSGETGWQDIASAPNNESGDLDDGINYAIERLCEILDVDPKSISWDAATETLDGDVSSVICNVLRAAYGEGWSSKPDDTARIRAAIDPDDGWKLVPRTPTDAMMQAGLYQASHDAKWEDVYSSWVDMVDASPANPAETQVVEVGK